MALSAGDGQIIAVIENEPKAYVPRGARYFEGLERRIPHWVRRHLLAVILVLAWIGLLFLARSYGPGPWLCAALAATWAAIAPAVARSAVRRRSSSGKRNRRNANRSGLTP
jgi:hypothetical protein